MIKAVAVSKNLCCWMHAVFYLLLSFCLSFYGFCCCSRRFLSASCCLFYTLDGPLGQRHKLAKAANLPTPLSHRCDTHTHAHTHLTPRVTPPNDRQIKVIVWSPYIQPDGQTADAFEFAYSSLPLSLTHTHTKISQLNDTFTFEHCDPIVQISHSNRMIIIL